MRSVKELEALLEAAESERDAALSRLARKEQGEEPRKKPGEEAREEQGGKQGREHGAGQLLQRIAALEATLARKDDDAAVVQAATSELLRIISNSAREGIDPLAEVVAAARRLSDSMLADLWLRDGEEVVLVARSQHDDWTVDPLEPVLGQRRPANQIALMDRFVAGQVRNLGPDEFAAQAPTRLRRNALFMPLDKASEVIGWFTLLKPESTPFAERDAELIRVFAAISLIGIDNARLLSDLRERTTEAREALNVQRVMADVLKIVASAPSNLEAVLPEIGRAVERLTASEFVLVGVSAGDIRINWNSGMGIFQLSPGYPQRAAVRRVAGAQHADQ
jgi:hypothetical protein